ncbi:MAG: twin-arginine translocase subunit TatC [Bacteroidia bacterium]|nr:twin-arginine translocase subunit TatC [Bacteroidia bacterium]
MDAPKKKPKGFDSKMSFLDHLEELRWHLIRSLLAIAAGSMVCLIYVREIVQYVVLGPLRGDFPTHRLLCRLNAEFCGFSFEAALQAVSPAEQFTKALVVSVVGGFVVAFPYVVWELWRFIKPGLYQDEIRRTKGLVGMVASLFFAGATFAYFVVLPFTLRFFAAFSLADGVQNIWRIGEVIALVVQFVLVGGLVFELPALSLLFSRLGFLTPALLKRFRKHALVACLILAGVLTPGPDVISQLLLAVPMLGLYELSIAVSASVERKRKRQLEAMRKKIAEARPLEA